MKRPNGTGLRRGDFKCSSGRTSSQKKTKDRGARNRTPKNPKRRANAAKHQPAAQASDPSPCLISFIRPTRTRGAFSYLLSLWRLLSITALILAISPSNLSSSLSRWPFSPTAAILSPNLSLSLHLSFLLSLSCAFSWSPCALFSLILSL